jgi:hypothetical protein
MSSSLIVARPYTYPRPLEQETVPLGLRSDVTQKGQIMIPLEVRRALGVHPVTTSSSRSMTTAPASSLIPIARLGRSPVCVVPVTHSSPDGVWQRIPTEAAGDNEFDRFKDVA